MRGDTGFSRSIRPAVASAGAALAAVGVLSFGWSLVATRGLAAAALAGSALLLHRRALGTQLLVRGLWTSALLLSGLNAILGWRTELVSSSLVVVGTATALTALGRRGLESDVPAGSFAPVAFRGSLVVAMAMALADAQSLIFYGLAWLESRSLPTMSLLLGALLASGVVGLYRLRVWGLLLALSGAATVCLLALADKLDVPAPVQTLLAITSAIQLAALAPLARAALRGRRAATDDSTHTARGSGTRIDVEPAPVATVPDEADGEAEAELSAIEDIGHDPARAARRAPAS